MRQRKSYVLLIVACTVTVGAMWLTPSAWAADTFKVLHSFTWAKTPQGNLIFDAAGNLYGTTAYGGAHGFGIVYKLARNPDGTRTLRVLHSFTGADGHSPLAGMAFDAAGNLYGTTYWGGGSGCGGQGCGVVYKLTPNSDGTWTESVIHSFPGFTGADGQSPQAGLIFDGVGNLYGTTSRGGTSACGGVFRLMPNSDGIWTETLLYSFTCAEGYSPAAELILDGAGNLYGTAPYGGGSGCGGQGCGTVYKLAPNSGGTWTESVLHTFTGADGGNSFAGLTFDSAGNLYGTAGHGGVYSTPCNNGCGVVFKLSPNSDGTWTESVLHSFTGAEGYLPFTRLTFSAGGDLYSTTGYGGCSGCGGQGCGTVYKLAPNSDGTWTESVLHAFVGYGRTPIAPVVFDEAGNLYGTTSRGSTNSGLVFEITP